MFRETNQWKGLAARLPLLGCLLIQVSTNTAQGATPDNVKLVAPFIAGSSIYSARQLADSYSSHIGQTLTSRTVAEMVEAIESQYRSDGFVVPVVTVEDDTVRTSTPRLFIHEAAVTQVRLRGNAGPGQEELLESIHSLASLRPIRIDRTREILSSIQRLPGVSVRASFVPLSTGLNEFALEMDVSYRAVSANVAASNRGSRASGRELVSARVALNGLLSQREFITLDGVASTSFDQYHYAGIQFARAIGASWLTLSASDIHARPWAADDRYDSHRYALQMLSPTWQGETAQLSALGRFVAMDSTLANESFGPLERNLFRKVEAGLVWSSRADGGSRVSTILVRGLDAFGAGTRTFDDVTPSDPAYSKLLLSAARTLNIGDRSGLRLDFTGEYAIDAVPNAEQFVFGGGRFGRALEAGDLAGQSGAAARIQVEHESPWRAPWTSAASLFAGVDYGYAWSTNAGYRRDHAASTSLGLELDSNRFSSSFELAAPLHRPHYSETDSGVAALIQVQWTL